ncbi:hypothetical protein LXL04_018284 [Taraxacum kok-saghyz]
MHTRSQQRADLQDARIDQLTTQLTDMSAVITSMKEVLANLPQLVQVAIKGKPPTDASPKSATPPLTETPTPLPLDSSLFSVPKVNQIPLTQKLQLAQMCMDGIALNCGTKFRNAHEALGSLFQEGTIDEYIEEFEAVSALIPDQSEEQSIGMFLRGLKSEIRNWVRTLNPSSCDHAMELARHVALATTVQPDRSSKFKSAIQGGPYTPPSNWKPTIQKPEPIPTTKPPPGPLVPKPFSPNRTRHLSKSEWEERRRQGLCFGCGQKYTPQHKCTAGQLRIMLLADGDEVSDTGEVHLLEFEDVKDTPDDGECKSLELCGVAADSTSSDLKTLKLMGDINGFPALILIDSGATHNFISKKLARALGLDLHEVGPLGIRLGDGNRVWITHQCRNVSLRFGSFMCTVDALVYDLGPLDFILGIAWLRKLGDVLFNWQTHKIKFWHFGEQIRLKGINSPLLDHSSLKHCLEHQLVSLTVDTTELSKLNGTQQRLLDTLLDTYATLFQNPQGLPPARAIEHKITLFEVKGPVCVRPYRYPHAQKDEIQRQVHEMLHSGIIRVSQSSFSIPVILVKKKDASWRLCIDYRALNKVTVPDKYPIPVVDELLDELHGSQFFSKRDLKSGFYQVRVRKSDIEKTAFRTHDRQFEFLVMPFGLTNAPATFQALMNEILRPLLRQGVLVFFDDILVYSALSTVLTLLHTHELVVNQKKSHFGLASVEYLGHIIDQNGVSMDPSKIQSITDWPVPSNVKGVRGFLGLTGYYRKFIRGKALTEKTLAKSAYEKEIMALALSIQHWRPNLLGRNFTVFTDQKSLKHLLEQQITTPDQQNWLAKLMGYHFSIAYKPGHENRAADALSRIHEGSELLTMVSSPQWLDGANLLDGYESDPKIQRIMQHITTDPLAYPKFALHNGRLYYKHKLVLPTNSPWIPQLLKEFHCSPSGGHSGYFRTYKKLSANIYWFGMTKTVQRFVQECDICQRYKSSTLAPAGLLQPLPIPSAVWEEISLDFITGLPKSKGFEAILVVVDRLSKYCHFIPLKHPYTARSLADIFLMEIIRLHGIPKSILRDRDPLFLSKFWQEIFKMQGSELKFSSAYHPETDGQTEVVNRSLETHLRCFAADQPKTWACWIPWAEFWHNTTHHTSTNTPFEIVYGRPPPTLFRYAPEEIKCEAVQQELQDRDEAIKQLKFHLLRAQSQMKSTADKHRRDVNFQIGEWVFLKLRPHRQQSVIRRINQKLPARFYGPFLITARVGPVAYRLQLPDSARIHPVFHVSLLKKVVGNAYVETELPPGLRGDPTSEKHLVEQWLVQWAEDSSEDSTWEDTLVFQTQFPSFKLEDKLVLQEASIDKECDNESINLGQPSGPSSWIVYQRRPRTRGGE